MYARRGGGNQSATHVRASDFNARLEKTRQAEAQNKTLRTYHAQNTRYDAAHQSDQRVDTMRRMQRFQRQNEELMTGYTLEQQGREEQLKKTLADQNEQLSAALFDVKTQKEAEETNVRRICEESEELKALHSKLRAAKISRIRATQLAERDAIQIRDEEREAAMDAEMEQNRVVADRAEKDAEAARAIAYAQSMQVLQDQIAHRQKAKKAAYESFLKEKAMVDEIVQGIEREDRAKQQAMLSKQKELQDNIRMFLAERKAWREVERQKAEEELRKIKEYNLLQEERHRKLSAQKQTAADNQDKVLQKLTKEIESKRKEEEEMRALLDELYQEEAEQKSIAKEQAEMEKRLRMKQDMIAANEYQKALKAKLAAEAAAEEQNFREEMMRRFAEDKRLESMNAMRRRREMENYKKEVERLVEERRKVFEESVKAELEELRSKQEQEDYRQAVIERERARLLAEYASDLQDHLPKGVLRNPNDFEMVYGRPPAFDEDKEERDLIASRNTGLAIGTSNRTDSRASMGRRASSRNVESPRPGSRPGASPRRTSSRGGPSESPRPFNGQGRPNSRPGENPRQGSRPGQSQPPWGTTAPQGRDRGGQPPWGVEDNQQAAYPSRGRENRPNSGRNQDYNSNSNFSNGGYPARGRQSRPNSGRNQDYNSNSNSNFFNGGGTGPSPRDNRNSRESSRNGDSRNGDRMGSYENQKGPSDRPFW